MQKAKIFERILSVYKESVKLHNHKSEIMKVSTETTNQPNSNTESINQPNLNLDKPVQQYSSHIPEMDGNYFLFFNDIYTTPLRKFLKKVLKKIAWPILKRQVYFNTVVKQVLYNLIQESYENEVRSREFRVKIDDIESKLLKLDILSKNIEKVSQVGDINQSKIHQIESYIEQLSQLELKVEQLSQLELKVEQLSQLEPKVEQLSQLEPKVEQLSQLEPKVEKIAKLESRIENLSQLESQVKEILLELRQDNSLPTKVSSVEQAKIDNGLWFNDSIIVGYRENGEAFWAGTNERILEKSFVLQSLSRLYDSTEIKILDVGSCESLLAYELASLNYSVTAIDIRPIALSHPNLKFVKTDICKPVLTVESFDCVIALSTLEHIGLGWYGDQKGDTLDCEAVRQIHSLLKKGGYFILTVPFGKKATTPVHRIYDRDSLQRLVQGFDIFHIVYGVRLDDFTWNVTNNEVEALDREHNSVNYQPGAVAMLVCRKSV